MLTCVGPSIAALGTCILATLALRSGTDDAVLRGALFVAAAAICITEIWRSRHER
jgi:hypothetical protein